MEKYITSDDKNKLDINLIYNFLTNAYWAKGRTLDEVEKSIENSICFGIYIGDKQIGFARVLTDFVTVAYLLDVFICEEYRGNGYSKILLKEVFSDIKFSSVKKWMLATDDAHTLYEKFGFKPLASPEKLMEMT